MAGSRLQAFNYSPSAFDLDQKGASLTCVNAAGGMLIQSGPDWDI
jgi:hypothetical protein